MNDKEKLTHKEIMGALTMCFRELVQTEVSHRNMPNIINRGKATAMIVTAMHREQIMEDKRKKVEQVLLQSEKLVTSELKKLS